MQAFVQDGIFWHLLTFCAGVGGSLLIIGSAAGVVAMGLKRSNSAGTCVKSRCWHWPGISRACWLFSSNICYWAKNRYAEPRAETFGFRPYSLLFGLLPQKRGTHHQRIVAHEILLSTQCPSASYTSRYNLLRTAVTAPKFRFSCSDPFDDR